MFKSIGTVIVLYAIVSFFSHAATSFESALVATFAAVETAANVTTQTLEAQSP
jgi:hypothetical protein